MALPLQITFRNTKHSIGVEDWIRDEAAKLETFYNRIMGCRVAIEVPHRHQQKGKPLHVRIDLNLPGREIVVKREPVVLRRSPVSGSGAAQKRVPPQGSHSDLHLVIHDAFKAAGRRLQDYARRRQGHVKAHEPAA